MVEFEVTSPAFEQPGERVAAASLAAFRSRGSRLGILAHNPRVHERREMSEPH